MAPWTLYLPAGGQVALALHGARGLGGRLRWACLLTGVLCLVCGIVTGGQADSLPLALPDTSVGIHVGLPFDYDVSPPSSELGAVDLVWGSSYAQQPPGVHKSFYLPIARDEDTRYYSQAHPVSWYIATHPDWVEYQCDRHTVAYAFGTTTSVPLDTTNPAVQAYIEQTYMAPALAGTLPESPHPYDGIALDNIGLSNGGSWSGQGCGHFSSSGAWVQQYLGTADDPAYRAAQVAVVGAYATWLHSHYPGATLEGNFSYDGNYPAESSSILRGLDLDFDEQGFTSAAGTGLYLSPLRLLAMPGVPIPTGSGWLALVQALSSVLTTPSYGWLDVNQEPVGFAQATPAQVQWALANYLLLKNNASYFYLCGYQQYGQMLLLPAYRAQIGTPEGSYYAAQQIYMRAYTGGYALVNPSATITYPVVLDGQYTDVYGNVVTGTVQMAPQSGLVLLGSVQPIATPTATYTTSATPTATSSPTVTTTPTATSTPTLLPWNPPLSLPHGAPHHVLTEVWSLYDGAQLVAHAQKTARNS